MALNSPNTLRRVVDFVWPHRKLLVSAQAADTLISATLVCTPPTIGAFVAAALAHDGSTMAWLLGFFICLSSIHAASAVHSQRATSRLALLVTFDVREALFSHLQDVPLSDLDKVKVGQNVSRLQTDVGALQALIEVSSGSLEGVLTMAGYLFVIFRCDWRAGLPVLVSVPTFVCLQIFLQRFAKTTFRQARDAAAEANATLAENINGIRIVQGFRREAKNFLDYSEKAKDAFKAAVSAALLATSIVPILDLITGVTLALILLGGGAEAARGRIGVGALITVILATQRFFDPLRRLTSKYTVIQRATAAGDRIFELLDRTPVMQDGKAKLTGRALRIEFEGVTFGYEKDKPVLHDVSFTIEPGTAVALVGPTGSGKTSVASLTSRLYDVLEGSVRIGGLDVRNVSRSSLNRHIGVVLQEPFLFSGTIAENIAYNAEVVTREKVYGAARAVEAHEFIMRLPLGYQAQVGQRGCNLSAGQRQLIAFARTLLADPQVLILDEATANIDSFTEQKIQRALQVLLAARTCLIIAHRLSTVRNADKIVVLNAGRVVEQGRHEALMLDGGLYATLYSSAEESFDDLIAERNL